MSDEPASLQREVWPAGTGDRRPCALLGFVAGALFAAAAIDAALWHHNAARRDLERRAAAAEQHAVGLALDNQRLREQVAASQQHARALHDELLERNGVEEDTVFVHVSPITTIDWTAVPRGAAPARRAEEVLP